MTEKERLEAEFEADMRQILSAAVMWIGDMMERCRQCDVYLKHTDQKYCPDCAEGLIHAAALCGIADALTPIDEQRITLPEPFLSECMEIYHDRSQSGIEYPHLYDAGPDPHG